MSVIVPLEVIPNQELSIQLDDIRYVIRLRTVDGVMALDLSADEVDILTGERQTTSEFVIPYQHLEGDGGNFGFDTDAGDYPFWDQFGLTQTLIYFSVEEMAAFRGD